MAPRLGFVGILLAGMIPTLMAMDPWMRAALPAGDGWIPPDDPTVACIGGGRADAAHTLVVRTRDELVAALDNRKDAAPRLIIVQGMIDLTPAGGPEAVQVAPYTFAGYVASMGVDPGQRTGAKASAAMERARMISSQNYRHQVMVVIPSDTTLVGDGPGAGLRGGGIHLKKTARNVILRNLRIEDAWDPFPKWDPGDGEDGNWNSEIDGISVEGAQRVWIDHCTLTDGGPDHPHDDARAPVLFTRRVQHHDGLLDIKSGADLVTVSWCRFEAHDKVSMLGFSDRHVGDRGLLRTTFHHNLFLNVTQRTPRVRFGQVHGYNNLHIADGTRAGYPFESAWGVGVESALVLENNLLEIPGIADPARLVALRGGTCLTATGTWLNGRPVEPTATLGLEPAAWRPGPGTSGYGAAAGPDPVDGSRGEDLRGRILRQAGSTLGSTGEPAAP